MPAEAAAKIRKTIKSSTAWSRVKEVGNPFLNGDAVKAYDEIEEQCNATGLFIVPVGELEIFYPQISDHGTKWVNAVFETVDLKNEPKLKASREFVEQIIAF